ncbi:cell envelope integrity EipB family protein [Azospirillum halopraeferens]|uniref:cell envelope integrity EipB family protein n=1 Tax=Azospirillum halopraeferens TaxID=34010 RepID=UPI000415976F|nr:cell envelope integrity EipB family protein [Azospirillum halopraeferens]
MDAIPTNRRSAPRFAARLIAGGAIAALALTAGAGLGAGTAFAGAEILPHRALYTMSLGKARSSSKVANVSGLMSFEWADACEGWTTQQRFMLRFVYSEGEEMTMTTTYSTWETKDGLRYRFNVRKLVNGEPDEDVRGSARLDASGGGGTAEFAEPDELEMELPAGTMFPTAHTITLLERARSGESFLNRPVFDGADVDGPTEISAVIGRPVPASATAAGGALAGQTGWPVRLAFFPDGTDSPQPEYEMSIRLLQNGVAESLEIDYGDFTVNAILDRLEALPRSGC